MCRLFACNCASWRLFRETTITTDPEKQHLQGMETDMGFVPDFVRSRNQNAQIRFLNLPKTTHKDQGARPDFFKNGTWLFRQKKFAKITKLARYLFPTVPVRSNSHDVLVCADGATFGAEFRPGTRLSCIVSIEWPASGEAFSCRIVPFVLSVGLVVILSFEDSSTDILYRLPRHFDPTLRWSSLSLWAASNTSILSH